MKYFLFIFFALCSISSFGQSAEELNATFIKLQSEGDYVGALTIAPKLKDAVEKKFGKRSLELGTILYQIASIYEKINDYANAEKYLKDATETFKLAAGEESAYYGQGLHNLANFYKDFGKYSLAKEYYNKAISIYKKAIGEDHERYGDCLDNYGVLLIYMGNYLAAKPLIEQGSEIRKAKLGERSTTYGSSLSNLGLLNSKFGNYRVATKYYMQAMGVYKESVGEKHAYYASTLKNIAYMNQRMGNYANAELFYKTAISIYERSLGKDSDDYAFAITGLATYYGETGNFSLAEPLLKEALTIIEKILGNEHPFYGDANRNLGGLYILMGNFGKGVSFLTQSLEITKKNFGEQSLEYAVGITAVAHMLTLSGQYADAEKISLKAIDYFEKKSATAIPEYTSTLRLLSLIYQQLGKLDNARTVLSKALLTTKQTLGENHIDYAATLIKLASVEEKASNYKASEKYYKEAIDIYKKVLGPEHVDYAKTLIEAGNMLANTHKIADAEKGLIKGSQLMLNYIQKNFLNLSETEKMKWWSVNSNYFECIPSFLMQHKNVSTEFLQQACSIQMQLKSAVLSDGMKTIYAARKKGSPDLLALLDQWQSNKVLLANQYSIPAENRMPNLDSLEQATNQQEKQVNNQSSTVMSFNKNLQVGFKDVQRKLNPNEAAIEFVQFELYRKDWTDSTFYAAFIFLPNDTVPHFIPLCEEQQLAKLLDSKNQTQEGFIKQLYRSTITGSGTQSSINKGDSISTLIFKPLLPFLKGIKTLHIAPVGLLNRVSFDALPITKTSLVIDQYIVRQSNGIKQLAEQKDTLPSNASTVLYGGINYNVSTPEKTKFVKTIIALPDNVKSNMGNSSFSYLPGTLEEVKSIQSFFNSNQKKNQLLVDTSATEESFKNLSGHSPQIIHLSTHGFSLPDPEKKKVSEQSDNQFSLASNPLLRSGIIMAGANYVWGGNTPIKGKEDGILTAYEISNLDLSNTELVVLSACETALGDIKGTEGVFGLQRAFKLAGVKNMIMSLWQVPDKETAELMNIFYGYKLAGMSIYESFNKAKDAMRKKYPPYYWAAFVLIE